MSYRKAIETVFINETIGEDLFYEMIKYCYGVNIIEIQPSEVAYESAMESDTYEHMMEYLEGYYKEISDYINRAGDDEIVFDYTGDDRYLIILPKSDERYIDAIGTVCELDYDIDINYKEEEKEQIDAATEVWKDSEEYNKDPAAYYGVGKY